jgi:hypothetical protein
VLAKLILPLNGKFTFATNTKITFKKLFNGPNEEVINSTWADRGQHQFDFSCAANWVVAGTSQNPNFGIPCFTDTAKFSDVCQLIVR